MNKEKIYTATALLCGISGTIVYNRLMFSGHSSPNAVSWGIWALITVLNFTSYRSMSGDWVKSLLPTQNSILCIATFAAVAYRGHFDATTSYDKIALALGVAASIVWWSQRRRGAAESALRAQVLLQIAIGIGFIPTYLGVWYNPAVEHPTPWFVWSVMYLFQLVLIRLRWRGQKMDLLYPINNLILHAAVAVLVLLL